MPSLNAWPSQTTMEQSSVGQLLLSSVAAASPSVAAVSQCGRAWRRASAQSQSPARLTPMLDCCARLVTGSWRTAPASTANVRRTKGVCILLEFRSRQCEQREKVPHGGFAPNEIMASPRSAYLPRAHPEAYWWRSRAAGGGGPGMFRYDVV